MKSKIPIKMLFEASPKKALYDTEQHDIEFIEMEREELCQGFGNYAQINGKNIFVAIFANNDRLFLLCNELYELNHTDFEVKLKSRFFKKDVLSLFKDGVKLFDAEAEIGNFDGDVIETIYTLFKSRRNLESRIDYLVRFNQEVDLAKRREINVSS